MHDELVISGVGVVSAIGQGKDEFSDSLFNARHSFSVMRRPGRQHDSSFLGAEIQAIEISDSQKSYTRNASLSAQAALAAVTEAWIEARLDLVDPSRVGLIIGGSNLQQRELVETHRQYVNKVPYIRPSYGLSFLDTDICGVCTAALNIRGMALTVGAASASGQLSIIQAIHAVLAGEVDACIAVGALMDLSYWECHALRSSGAMGSDRFADRPDLACRPFNNDRDGFIFGECCGAVVIERRVHSDRRSVLPYARICGWGVSADANRHADPSMVGEIAAIRAALDRARCAPTQVDYINPHGSGSILGDQTELEALRTIGLAHARINATKSIVGHGLTAAGTVEVIATLLQMQRSRLHPTRNLDSPLDVSFNWVQQDAVEHTMRCALTLSMGFSGINTALCLRHCA